MNWTKTNLYDAGKLTEQIQKSPGITLAATIRELGDVIDSISDIEYTTVPGPEFTSTIGQQTRHTLDHIRILVNGLDARIVSYDKRKRGTDIETDRISALKLISELELALLNIIHEDLNKEIDIEVLLHSDTPAPILKSTVGREIGFLLNHTIHHNALVSIMLKRQGHTVEKSFGYAPSTIAYIKNN